MNNNWLHCFIELQYLLVPLDLLFPSIKNPLALVTSHCPCNQFYLPISILVNDGSWVGSSLNLRFAGKGDLEPRRCRRIDGKKWRCSRDMASDQKYYERHMHLCHPRSRKPVEHPKKKTRPSHTQDLPLSPSTIVLPNSCITTSHSSSPFLINVSQPFHQNQTTKSLDELNQKVATFRSLGFVTSFKEPGKTNERVSLSSLSLLIRGNNIVDNEMGHIHMGVGVIDPNQNQEYGAKSHLSNWLPPASWTAPTLRKPLAEALRRSKVNHAVAAAAAITIEANSNPYVGEFMRNGRDLDEKGDTREFPLW
ncbi:hypothetical protein SLEP1_g3198 [Rubroshorea leprosula]|uniref:Growth-regulating factor n=1 Tax=Rubroshorea leprosula TaxID=152421 RepID=A0AAV5HK14_9ROSI|nr:hypothetical protein SLEP1_g3198 [Rubroshorea leprosula]